MYGYIYLTTNKINGKKYIGQHRYDKPEIDLSYLGSGKILTEAISKYGKENFSVEILDWCQSEEELNNKEIYFISLYDAVNDPTFYNINNGGLGHTSAPWNKGTKGKIKVTDKMKDALVIGQHLPASEKLKEKLHNRKELVDYIKEYRNKLTQAQSRNRTVNDGQKNIIVKENELNYWLSLPGISRGRVKTRKFND